jgi:hypothetical protein
MFTAPVTLMSKEDIYSYLNTPFNPPVVNTPEAEEAFSDEWWDVREALMQVFRKYGEEDDFGDKDYLVSESLSDSRGIGVTITSPALLKNDMISDVLGVLLETLEAYSIYFCTETAPLFNFFIERDRIMIECEECPNLPTILGLEPINKK